MVSQLDYAILFMFPIFYGVIGLFMWVSPSGPIDASQLPPDQLADLLNGSLSFLRSTATTLGGLALAQLLSCFYLASKIGRGKSG